MTQLFGYFLGYFLTVFWLYFDCICIVVVAGKLLAWPCGRISRINFHLFRCFCFVCLAGFCLAVLIVQLQCFCFCCWPEVQVGLGNTRLDGCNLWHRASRWPEIAAWRLQSIFFFIFRFSFDLPLCIYDSQLAQCPPVKLSVSQSVSLSIGVIVIDAATKKKKNCDLLSEWVWARNAITLPTLWLGLAEG